MAGVPIFAGAAGGGAAGGVGGALLTGSPLGLVSSGLGLVKGLSGLFGGGGKSESNSSAAYSGVGGFFSDNQFDFSYSKSPIDLDDPVHVAVLAGLVVLAIYTYKKVK